MNRHCKSKIGVVLGVWFVYSSHIEDEHGVNEMTNQELAAQIEAFANAGGKIKQCIEGDTAVRQVPRKLWQCQCGCHGDYTDHSMRAGESGRDSFIIVQ